MPITITEKYVCCPLCHGSGGEFAEVLWKGLGGGPWEECPLCQGGGQIPMKVKMDYIRSFKKKEEAR